jgi:hypothetical protein
MDASHPLYIYTSICMLVPMSYMDTSILAIQTRTRGKRCGCSTYVLVASIPSTRMHTTDVLGLDPERLGIVRTPPPPTATTSTMHDDVYNHLSHQRWLSTLAWRLPPPLRKWAGASHMRWDGAVRKIGMERDKVGMGVVGRLWWICVEG